MKMFWYEKELYSSTVQEASVLFGVCIDLLCFAFKDVDLGKK